MSGNACLKIFSDQQSKDAFINILLIQISCVHLTCYFMHYNLTILVQQYEHNGTYTIDIKVKLTEHLVNADF